MAYKLFSFDVDGTLFSYDKTNWGISDKSVYALKKLKKNGYCLVLNSGRTLKDIPHKLAGLFDYYVVCNGSALIDKAGETMYEIKIEESDLSQIVNFCKNQKRNIGLKNIKHFYYYNFEGVIPEYMQRCNETYPIFDAWKVHEEQPILSAALDIYSDEIKGFEKAFSNLEFAHGGFDYYEVYSKKANKVKGLEVILEKEKITKEQCVAFGDSMNDFAILKEVGLPVIMADSHKILLEQFKHTCLPASQDGIYWYLKHMKVID